jgi:hypothetical protein
VSTRNTRSTRGNKARSGAPTRQAQQAPQHIRRPASPAPVTTASRRPTQAVQEEELDSIEYRGFGVDDGEEEEADLRAQEGQEDAEDGEDADEGEDLDSQYEDEDDDDGESEDFAVLEEDVEEYTAESYAQGVLVPMPSGKALRLRPYSLLSMLRQGRLPNHLQAAAERMLLEGDTASARPANREDARRQGQRSAARAVSQQTQNAHDSSELVDFLVCELVSSFRVVRREPRRGEVHVSQIFDADKQLIVTFAMQGQKALADFR